ncbi:VCBS repeat-containing protein [Candidatus Woesearchaeota archaeon]|nr:VCBS repeat-containing protein [Candidatus Woesearchaeota archaeon]
MINNDGLSDLIQGWGGVRKAWLNNVTGWREDSVTWAPSIDFASSSGTDEGTQMVDFDGDGKVDLLQAKDGSAKKAYLNTGNGWKDVSSQWAAPTNFVKSDGNDFGSRLVDLNGDGLIDVIEGYNFGTETKNAWLNNGSGWISSSVWNPPDVFTSSSRADNGMRFVDLNGDGLTDIFQDYKNGSATEREAFINNGNGWSNSSSWTSPEPFTKDGKNVGRRIGDIDGNGLGDIIIGYNDGSADIKRTLVRNNTLPYLLKNITNEFGGLTHLSYEKSTIFNNTGDDGLSDIGFNVWVVKEVLQNNSLYSDFNVLSNTSYYYFGGLYDFNDSEFRGFNIVNETLSDKSVISHYFHQSKQLKGKGFKTETYDSSGNIFSKIENNLNFTTSNYSYFIVNFLSTTSYTNDGNPLNPKIINTSYKYDNYGNLLSKTSFGDVSIYGDEKYENYTFAVNTSSWILDKPSWYFLFDADYNKIRETKYFYDNHQYGDPPSKGDLTKVENWLDIGGGNPTTYYTYDDFGNLYKQTDSLGKTTTREYGIKDDTHTYPDRITNALGHAIDYTYDVGTGNVISYKKHGVNFLYEYDTFGRITKDIEPYDNSDFPTKKYIYDFNGVAPEIIKVSQRTTSNNTIDAYYYYDGFANLVQIKSPNDDNSQQVVKNLFYDGMFRIKEEQNPFFSDFTLSLTNKSNTTNTTKYNYDTLGRITSVINPDGTNKNTTYNRWEINDYDENGNRHTYLLDTYDRIIAVTEYNTDFYLLDNETYNTTYNYDASDNLIGIRDTYGNEFNFTYDSLGRKIKLKDPDLGTWTYSYDLAGNLISQVGGGDNLITGDSYYREYNGLGQLKSVKEGNSSNGRLLEEYFYDSNGDRIKINRYSYTDGSNETIYTPYREWMQIRNSSGTFNFYYIYQDNTLVARLNPDGTKWFYHADHLGSTTLITNEQGNVVESEFYSPFGESLSVNSNEKNKLYTGQFKDGTGQYYYKTRYYKPDWTRFTQCDKIKPELYNPQLLNCYAYGLNNPYRYKDDSGNVPIDVIVDIGFIGYDIYKLAAEGKGKNNENINALKLDLVGAAVPYATGLGAASRVVKTTDKVADIKKITQASEKATEGVKVVDNAQDVSKAAIVTADSYKNLIGKIGRYGDLVKDTAGKKGEIQAHHLIEKRFLKKWGKSIDDAPAVILTREEHQKLTNTLARKIPFGSNINSPKQAYRAYREVYRDSPYWGVIQDWFIRNYGTVYS